MDEFATLMTDRLEAIARAAAVAGTAQALTASFEYDVAVECFGEAVEVERGISVRWVRFELAPTPLDEVAFLVPFLDD